MVIDIYSGEEKEREVINSKYKQKIVELDGKYSRGEKLTDGDKYIYYNSKADILAATLNLRIRFVQESDTETYTEKSRLRKKFHNADGEADSIFPFGP